jgi:autotransporter-associated beta strand protein
VLSDGGEWSPLQEASFVIPVDAPLFQPTGSADWTTDTNWNCWPLPYPRGTNVTVYLNAPVTADRDINLRAPVIIGSLSFQQSDSAFRNKLRDRSTGNTLTFFATNGPAKLAVNGSGAGYVELEVAADTLLASDLRVEVNNTAGSSAYGALRLRANWRGTGGIIKEGDGIVTFTGDSKSYTGATAVNQGVLALTESAVPFCSSPFAVTEGGQLRLTSASTDGAPRVYAFGCPLTLGSMGRGGALPASGQGVSGGLRFQPDSDDSVAAVTNAVVFAGLSAVHVEGSRITLELSGPLSGPLGLVKTGGGRLVLSAQSRRYLAPVTVSNGTLAVDGRVLSAVSVAPGASLAGAGRAGPLSGGGTVALDRTVLTAPSAKVLNYAFSFAAAGSPAYGTPSACGNGVLRTLLLDEAPAAVDIYLDAADLGEGVTLRGGFFVEGEFGLARFLAAATVRFFTPSASGAQKFAGRAYDLFPAGLLLTVTAMPETADFGDGPRSGEVLEVRVAGAPVTYGQWATTYYPAAVNPGEPSLASPSADPSRQGVDNLLRYALDIRPGDALPARLPRLSLADGAPVYRFHFDPGKRDIAYRVEASSDLREWTRVLFDSRTDSPALLDWDGESLSLPDQGYGPAAFPAQFYRLRVLLLEP